MKTGARITDVKVHLATARWVDDPWVTQALHSTALVQIKADNGLDGWGEVTLGYFMPESVVPLVAYFAPVLLGRDVMDLSRCVRALYDEAVWWARQGAGRSAISGIELALWDLKGKTLGLPVYQLLGGAVRDRIPVYASGGSSIWPPEENIRKLTRYAENGYLAAKLSTGFYEVHATDGPQQREVEVSLPFGRKITEIEKNFAALRRELGPGFDLAIDGHQGGVPEPIPVSEAIEIAEALAPHRLRFYEEPLAYTDLSGYRELKARSRIPIAGGESYAGLDQFHAVIAGNAVHVIQPDLGFVGGLAETLRIIHHADAYNIATALHTGAAAGPTLAASWHLAAACQSVAWLEHVVAARSVHADFLADAFNVRAGTVSLPQAPGLGLKISETLLSKYAFVSGSGERT